MNLVDVFIIHSATSATVDHCGSKIQASKITCHPRALSLHPYSHCPLYTMLIVNIVMHTMHRLPRCTFKCTHVRPAGCGHM